MYELFASTEMSDEEMTFKYNQGADPLELSIEKWKRTYNFVEKYPDQRICIHILSDSCALCHDTKVKNNSPRVVCKDCILFKMGYGCIDDKYDDYVNDSDDRENNIWAKVNNSLNLKISLNETLTHIKNMIETLEFCKDNK